MEFGQRLKFLRLEQKKTQQDIASSVGVSVVAVRSWEHGNKKPSLDALVALSDELGASVDSLLGLQEKTHRPIGTVLSPEEKTLLDRYQSLDQYGKRAVDTICAIEKERMDALVVKKPCKIVSITKAERPKPRYMPHYTSASAAGINAPLDGADFEMMLIDESIPSDADYAVDIHGDSMEPYIHDGDMVFVDKDAELSIGDVGIFCVDGAMYCKQYYLDDAGNLMLVSANQERSNTNIFISVDSGSSVTTCGKVLLGFRVELPEYLFQR